MHSHVLINAAHFAMCSHISPRSSDVIVQLETVLTSEDNLHQNLGAKHLPSAQAVQLKNMAYIRAHVGNLAPFDRVSMYLCKMHISIFF